eukprot:3278047-Pleurochrysis_carterae.AAC.1
MFLCEYDEIPYKALNYMAGELNYGGRVTDDKDRRLATCLLSDFYTERILHDDYSFADACNHDAGAACTSPQGLETTPSDAVAARPTLSSSRSSAVVLSRVYRAPPDGSLDTIRAFVHALPESDPPQIFGLHPNADITCARKETHALFAGVLSLQPRTAASAGGSSDAAVESIASDIEAKLPPQFDVGAARERYPTAYLESMNTVLVQEL